MIVIVVYVDNRVLGGTVEEWELNVLGGLAHGGIVRFAEHDGCCSDGRRRGSGDRGRYLAGEGEQLSDVLLVRRL